MTIFLRLCLCFLSLSFLWASNDSCDPWDVKISAGNTFQHPSRSVLLECTSVRDMMINNKRCLMMNFDVKDSDTGAIITSTGVNYYGSPDNALVFGLIAGTIRNNQVNDCIETAMAIFRAKSRSHLLFDKFVLGFVLSEDSKQLQSYFETKFRYIGSSPITNTQFFHIKDR